MYKYTIMYKYKTTQRRKGGEHLHLKSITMPSLSVSNSVYSLGARKNLQTFLQEAKQIPRIILAFIHKFDDCVAVL